MREDRKPTHCQNGRADVCLASQRDGIICPDDSCDIDDGVRKDHTRCAEFARRALASTGGPPVPVSFEPGRCTCTERELIDLATGMVRRELASRCPTCMPHTLHCDHRYHLIPDVEGFGADCDRCGRRISAEELEAMLTADRAERT